MTLSRRDCLRLTGGSLVALGLAQLLAQTRTASGAAEETIDHWLGDLATLGRKLGEGSITQTQWQQGMDEVFGRVQLSELLKWVDFARVSDELAKRDLGARGEIFQTLFVGKPGQTSDPSQPEESRVLISKLAHVKKGRSIPPHGHSSMVSAFMVIGGDFHVRQFDKIEDGEAAMIVKQSTDERQKPGAWSSVSDVRNNVHWLTAKSDDCFLFTTKLIRLDDEREFNGRINVDVLAGKDLGGGKLSAPKISFQEASERY